MNKKNKIYIGVVVLALVSVGTFAKVSHDKKIKEEKASYELKINNKVRNISGVFLNLDVQKDENKKLENLKKLISEKEEYEKGNEKDKKVIDAYDKTINLIKGYFKNKNNVTLNANKVEDLKSETVKVEDLKSKLDSLNLLKESIKKQEELVYNKDEFSKINKDIESMEKSFTDKINEINKKAAEEQKIKEAAEAKAAEEERVKKQEEMAKQAPGNLSSVDTISNYSGYVGNNAGAANQANGQNSSYQHYQNNGQNTKPAPATTTKGAQQPQTDPENKVNTGKREYYSRYNDEGSANYYVDLYRGRVEATLVEDNGNEVKLGGYTYSTYVSE